MRLHATFLAASVLIAPASAADWPMGGRSGDRNPVSPEKNAPSEWQVEGDGQKPRNIKWAAHPGGYHGLGGPVVAGGLVWVGTNETSDDETADNAVLICYRESDGKELYRHASARRGGRPSDWPGQGLSGSPLAEGDRLWFCNNRREVICLDVGPLRRGSGRPKEVWKLDMVAALGVHPRAVMIPSPETHGSPAAYKDFLYVPTNNGKDIECRTVPAPDAPSLVCVRKDTGKVVWSDHSPGKVMMCGFFASPLVVEAGGRAQVVHPQADGWVRSFDADTGKPLWKFDVNRKDEPPDDWDRVGVVGTPVHAGGRVYFATGRQPENCSGPGRLFCIDPTKTGDVSPELAAGPGKAKANANSAVVWSFAGDGPKEADRMHLATNSVAVHDGLVIAADYSGHVHCLDARTGRRHWTHDTRGSVFANPLVVDGKVYVGGDTGEVFVFEHGVAKKLLAKIEVDALIHAPPVYANGVLYLLTDRSLLAIAAKP